MQFCIDSSFSLQNEMFFSCFLLKYETVKCEKYELVQKSMYLKLYSTIKF